MRPRYGLTVLVCFYLLQFICSCENPYKNKVWGHTMEALPSPPCQGFYFPHYQMFSSVELSPFIQPCESQPRSYCIGGRKKKKNQCIACISERKKERNVSLSSFPFDTCKQICGPLSVPYGGHFAPDGQATRTFKEVSLQFHNIILSPFPFWASFPKQVSMSKENS